MYQILLKFECQSMLFIQLNFTWLFSLKENERFVMETYHKTLRMSVEFECQNSWSSKSWSSTKHYTSSNVSQCYLYIKFLEVFYENSGSFRCRSSTKHYLSLNVSQYNNGKWCNVFNSEYNLLTVYWKSIPNKW